MVTRAAIKPMRYLQSPERDANESVWKTCQAAEPSGAIGPARSASVMFKVIVVVGGKCACSNGRRDWYARGFSGIAVDGKSRAGK
jgi:hypothetical protein